MTQSEIITEFNKQTKMENVTWGVPTKNRNKKVEKYTTPVVTMHLIEKKGSNRRFTFNKAAREALGLNAGESYIAFGFDLANNTTFIKKFDSEELYTFKVNKSWGFRDAKTYNYLVKQFNLDETVDNELHFEYNNDMLNYVSNPVENTVEETVENEVENTPRTASINVQGEEVILVEPVNESTEGNADDLESQW